MATIIPAVAPMVDSSGVEVRVAANKNTAVSRPSLRMALNGIRASASTDPIPITSAISCSRPFLIPADWRFIQTIIQLRTPTAASIASPSNASAPLPSNSPAMTKIAAPTTRLMATAASAAKNTVRK